LGTDQDQEAGPVQLNAEGQRFSEVAMLFQRRYQRDAAAEEARKVAERF